MKQILQSNHTKSFVIKLLIFAVTIIAADQIFGALLKKSYFRQKQGYDYLTTHAIQSTTEPVLIFGSSRAVNIINPLITEQKIKLPSFNVGRIGQSIFYHYAVLKSVLARYTPQVIILSFDAGDLAKNQEDYDRIASLLPYYESQPAIEPVIELKGPFEKIKTVSKIYPYNSMLLPILNSSIKTNNNKYRNIKGYMPIKKKINGPLHTIDFTKTAALDQKKVNTYRSFIETCLQAGIKLHIVCPPYLIRAIGEDASIETAKDIADDYNIRFLDHSSDSYYSSNPSLFADFKHLNEKGSNKFTEEIMEIISPFN